MIPLRSSVLNPKQVTMIRQERVDAENNGEQQSLLESSPGSESLNDQVVYDSMASLNEAEDDDILEPEALGNLELEQLSTWEMICILSTAFSYGCIMTTLFLITLPVECERIQEGHSDIPKSVALGVFVSIAGFTQLISPLVGRLSDTFQPPYPYDIGQRMPYLLLGSVLTVGGLLCQMAASYAAFWLRYGVAFFAHMIGLNIIYAMMLAIIPDQVPSNQTGRANGILAGLLVTGSLFGFGLFHSYLRFEIQSMYGLYTCIVIASSILTGLYGHDRDVIVALHRRKQRLIRTKRRASINVDTASPKPHNEHQTRKQKVMKKIKKATRKVVITPSIVLHKMVVDPIIKLDCHTLYESYTIDRHKHRDFFWVTVSRLFYYCGMSVQTFFMYFLHDIIQGLQQDPEAAVATLSILGQVAGACTCIPVGYLSDVLFSGKRKPFVYFACFILGSTTFAVIFARTMHRMVILMLILGGANGIYLTMDTSLAVDTLPKDFDDDNGAAQLLGIWGVAAFLGSALGPMIGGPVLYFVGSKDNSTVPDVEDIGDIAEIEGDYSLAGYATIYSLSSVSRISYLLKCRCVFDVLSSRYINNDDDIFLFSSTS